MIGNKVCLVLARPPKVGSCIRTKKRNRSRFQLARDESLDDLVCLIGLRTRLGGSFVDAVLEQLILARATPAAS